MVEQGLYAAIAVVLAVGVFVAYFWGSNWLLDRSLSTPDGAPPEVAMRRDKRRSQIRPWLFIAPALLFLSVFLVYPVFETARLSLFGRFGNDWVGVDNYVWLFGDREFWSATLNNVGWLIIVPTLSVAFGLIIAVLASAALSEWIITVCGLTTASALQITAASSCCCFSASSGRPSCCLYMASGLDVTGMDCTADEHHHGWLCPA